MATQTIGIIMNGVTGRMGTNQHLIRSILAIRAEGGIRLSDGDVLMPDPILVGRNEARVKALAEAHGLRRFTVNLERCLADPRDVIYFDAQTTAARAAAVRAAVAAGKHIYVEKPTATESKTAIELARLAHRAGVKHGVVQDKLFLPGMVKLRRLIEGGFFGRIFAVRGEFGYWVFEGDWQAAQRPSWNYKKEEGGGIILDMLCHWRYLLDNLFGNVRAVSCRGATHIPERVDEQGRRYRATADDAAYATFELESGTLVQFNSSWCTRVYRDDLLTVHVDGTLGSAMAGLRACKIQHRATTPRPTWNPDIDNPFDFRSHWQPVPEEAMDNGFKRQWELFLRHVARDEPFPWNLLEGAKGVQLAELGLQSWMERRWVDVPPLRIDGE